MSLQALISHNLKLFNNQKTHFLAFGSNLVILSFKVRAQTSQPKTFNIEKSPNHLYHNSNGVLNLIELLGNRFIKWATVFIASAQNVWGKPTKFNILRKRSKSVRLSLVDTSFCSSNIECDEIRNDSFSFAIQLKLCWILFLVVIYAQISQLLSSQGFN